MWYPCWHNARQGNIKVSAHVTPPLSIARRWPRVDDTSNESIKFVPDAISVCLTYDLCKEWMNDVSQPFNICMPVTLSATQHLSHPGIQTSMNHHSWLISTPYLASVLPLIWQEPFSSAGFVVTWSVLLWRVVVYRWLGDSRKDDSSGIGQSEEEQWAEASLFVQDCHGQTWIQENADGVRSCHV